MTKFEESRGYKIKKNADILDDAIEIRSGTKSKMNDHTIV